MTVGCRTEGLSQAPRGTVLETRLNLRLTTEDAERLDRLASRTPLRRTALARELLRLGAEVLERDPGALVRGKERTS